MITINIDKAKEIKKGVIRIERKLLLEALDVEVMKNITNSEKLVEIESEKQRLRDITLKIDKLETIEELKSFTI